MKYILLLLTLTISAHAGEVLTNEMSCEKTETVFKALQKEYGEIPVVLGKSDDIAESTMSLWTNPDNNSWTIVATKDEISCVVGSGTKLKLVPYNKKNNV